MLRLANQILGCLVLVLTLWVHRADASERLALVVGNAEYAVGPLRNPVNDAKAIAAKLKTLGFTVIEGHDLDRTGMLRLVQQFRREMKPGGVALVFYSGHGVEVGAENYLLPIDNGSMETAEDVPISALSADYILSQMEAAGGALNVLVLDACRNNPLPVRVRGLSPVGGLAQMSAAPGTLIAYATRSGATASDGDGRHSPYTEALLEYLATPGLEITGLFNRVGLRVSQASRGTQVPWVSSSPIPNFMLAGDGAEADVLVPVSYQPEPQDPVEIALDKAQALVDAGDQQAGGKAFREALDLARERVQQAPADRVRQNWLLHALSDNADFLEVHQGIAAGLGMQAEAVRHAADLHSDQPDDIESLLGFDFALNHAMRLALEANDLDSTRAYLKQSDGLAPALEQQCKRADNVDVRQLTCISALRPSIFSIKFAVQTGGNLDRLTDLRRQAYSDAAKAEPSIDALLTMLRVFGDLTVGQLLMSQGRWNNARKVYLAAREEIPRIPAVVPLNESLRGMFDGSEPPLLAAIVEYGLAEVELEAGEYAVAVRYAKSAQRAMVAANLESAFRAVISASTNRVQGEALMELGEYVEARKVWEAMLADAALVSPPAKYPLAHSYLGEIAEIEGDYETAIRHYRQCLSELESGEQTAETRIRTLWSIAGSYAELGQTQDAVSTYGEMIQLADRYLNLRPNDLSPQVRMQLAHALYHQGSLRLAMDPPPPRVEIVLNLARAQDLLDALAKQGALTPAGESTRKLIVDARSRGWR